jgi:hypothetical protein
MAYLYGSDETERDLFHDDDYRAYLITRSSGEYRFARSHRKRVLVRLRGALRRVNGFWSNFVAAVADSKMRRVQRELWLRDIRYDESDNNWVTPATGQTRRRR